MTDAHVPDDVLEQYVHGILPESLLEAVEEHILFCHYCIVRAEELEAFVRTARNALERKPN